MKMESVLAAKGPNVVTISPDATIREAVAALVANNIGALVVIGDNHLPQGIISERDIIRETNRNSTILNTQVRSVMTTDVVCGSPADDVEAVLQTMTTNHFRHIPVVENGALVGIISIGDLVKAQLQDYLGSIDTLQTQLMNS